MRILFIHGGGDGAHAFDRGLLARLSEGFGDDVAFDYPHVVGLERIEWNTTHADLEKLLPGAAEGTIIVAHSIGAAAVLKSLSSGTPTRATAVVLLAAPYKADDSHWGRDDFSFPSDFAKNVPSALDVTMYHCSDDAVIPVGDAKEYGKKMPRANITIFRTGGHQFDGRTDAVARD